MQKSYRRKTCSLTYEYESTMMMNNGCKKRRHKYDDDCDDKDDDDDDDNTNWAGDGGVADPLASIQTRVSVFCLLDKN